jgi:hypothetical protein
MTEVETRPASNPEPIAMPGVAAGTIGQATAVEQARAIAEVQAAIVVAQQCPRDRIRAVAEMRDGCQHMLLAERAFFRYNRGGSQISGASIHLARELARWWGNVQYNVVELSRDDVKGESQMLAFAWDVQTNTRAATIFIVKHGRDTKEGIKKLTDLRDVYENNANMGARRLREQIFAVLPTSFIEEAKQICTTTLENGGGKALIDRISDVTKYFHDQYGLTADRLEAKIGRKADDWTPLDLAQFSVIRESLKRGETTVDEEFPQQRVTAADITGTATVAAASETAPAATAEPPSEPAAKPRKTTAKPAAPADAEPAELPLPPRGEAPDPAKDCPVCGYPEGEGHDDVMHSEAGVPVE